MNCANCKVNKIGPTTAPFGGYMCGNEHLQCYECNQRCGGQCGICNGATNFVQMNLRTSTPTHQLQHQQIQQLQQQQHHRKSPLLLQHKHEQQQLQQQQQPQKKPSTMSTPVIATAPPVESNNNIGSLNSNTSYQFPKAFFADIERQSSISQEELSMHDSQMSVSSEHSGDAEPMTLNVKPPMFNKSLNELQHTKKEKVMIDVASMPMMNVSNNNRNHASAMETLFFGRHEELTSHEQSASNFTMNQSLGPSLDHGRLMESTTTKFTNDIKHNERDIQEDTEEGNVIHTSEIRFMDSTESLKNYFSGGTMHPIVKHAKPETSNENQQESLSVRTLHDFECQNTASPAEMVENYLRSYGPLAVCHFPAYSFNHNCYHPIPCEGWTPQQRQALMRSICVSTESEPSLANQCPLPRTECPGKYMKSDYFVMQAKVVTQPPPPHAIPSHLHTDKSGHHSLDQRMQKVLGTFQEDPHQATAVVEKPLLEHSKNFIKIPATNASLPLETPPATARLNVCEMTRKESHEMLHELSNSHRAFYNPPGTPTPVSASCQSLEPQPQFQLISCPTSLANELAMTRTRHQMLNKPLPACQLNIPRSPICCPESTCTRMIFVSDFNKHLVVDHTKLPMERISPNQYKNFFLDPRLSANGNIKCHLLYLIRDKIVDLGSSKYKDFLPMLVMSTRVRLADLCGNPQFEDHSEDVSFLMIWLTGIVPEEMPVFVSLTVWPRSGRVPSVHVVHSGELYSIRKSQAVSDVCQSGQMLLLSEKELSLLTRDGKDMLELQVVVH